MEKRNQAAKLIVGAVIVIIAILALAGIVSQHHITYKSVPLSREDIVYKQVEAPKASSADGTITGKTTINWDETKYKTYYYPAIWKTSDSKKFIGLDHQIPLGKNGISLSEYYASSELSNLDGGSKGKQGSSVPIVTTPRETTAPPTVTTAAITTPQPTVTTTSSAVTTPEPEITTTRGGARPEPTKWGDANLDDTVDVSDAVLLCRYLVSDKDAKISDQGIVNAGVEKAGEAPNSEGVIKILKFIAKIITEDELAPQA